VAFISGASGAWGRAEVRHWLLHDYAAATAHTCVGDRWGRREPTEGMHEGLVRVELEAVRARVLRMIQSAATAWYTTSFARDMIDARYVMVVYDRTGDQGFAPASHEDMRLVDRVASLFIADYLNQPADYTSVVCCEACGELSLGGAQPHARHAPWCADPPVRSGFVERGSRHARRRDRPTLRGVG
jgi:hypothetical protein